MCFYSKLCCSLFSNNSVLAYAWEERFGELIWLLVLNYLWGRMRNLGLRELKSPHTDCWLICSFGEGLPAVNVWLHRRWSAHDVLLISHICSASAQCQYLIQRTLPAGSEGASTAICRRAKVIMIWWFDRPENELDGCCFSWRLGRIRGFYRLRGTQVAPSSLTAGLLWWSSSFYTERSLAGLEYLKSYRKGLNTGVTQHQYIFTTIII